MQACRHAEQESLRLHIAREQGTAELSFAACRAAEEINKAVGMNRGRGKAEFLKIDLCSFE